MLQRRRRLVAALAITALAGAALTGCGDDDEETTSSPADGGGGDNTLQIEMVDYAYDVSGSLQEGWTTFEVSNTGDVYHMIGFGRLKDGVSLADVEEALSGGPGGSGGPPPEGEGEEGVNPDAEGAPVPGDTEEEQSLGEIELISAQTDDSTTTSSADDTTTSSTDTTAETTDDTATTQEEGNEGGEGEEGGGEDPFEALFEDPEGTGGPPGGFYAPGESMTVTTDSLEAGEYALICFISDGPEEPPHFAQGMINSFTVEESDEPAGEEPEADVEVTIGDESIEMPEEVPAEETTYGITFEGGEHEFAFVEVLDEDASFQEIEDYFATFDDGVLPTKDELQDGPALFSAFIFSQTGSDTYYITRSLRQGTWYIGCGLDESEESEDGSGRDHADTELKKVTVT